MEPGRGLGFAPSVVSRVVLNERCDACCGPGCWSHMKPVLTTATGLIWRYHLFQQVPECRAFPHVGSALTGAVCVRAVVCVRGCMRRKACLRVHSRVCVRVCGSVLVFVFEPESLPGFQARSDECVCSCMRAGAYTVRTNLCMAPSAPTRLSPPTYHHTVFSARRGSTGRRRHTLSACAPRAGAVLAGVVQMLFAARPLVGGMRNCASSRSMHARGVSSLRAVGDTGGKEEIETAEEEEDYPSMHLNLANDVGGGTSGYPIPMVASSLLSLPLSFSRFV